MRRIAILALAAALAGGPALAQSSGDGAAERPRQPGQGMMMPQGDGSGMMGGGQGMMQGRGMGPCGEGDGPRKAGRHGKGHHGMHAMHQRMKKGGMMGGMGMMGGGPGPQMMMKAVFALMDADGSGALSLQEVHDAQSRLFAHADENGDGELARAEMEGFMRPDRPRRAGTMQEP